MLVGKLMSTRAVSLQPSSEGGRIQLDRCAHLRDLTGLEQLTEWSDLELLGNPKLESLNGLQAPRTLRSVGIFGESVRDLSALARVKHIDTFDLTSTGVESFDGFQLESVEVLHVYQNAALVSLEGLNGLKRIDNLIVSGNDALEQPPEWPDLDELTLVEITGNAGLRSVPSYRRSHGSAALWGRGRDDTLTGHHPWI